MKPTHIAYTVRNYLKDKQSPEIDAAWSKIGVAFLHQDGHGFDVVLDAVPVDGRVVLRTNDERVKQLQKDMRAKSA